MLTLSFLLCIADTNKQNKKTKITIGRYVGGGGGGGGAGIAQMVERPTEKPGAMLTRVRAPGVASYFSIRVNFQSRLSYGVHTAPVCNRMHQHVTNPKH